MGALEKMGTPRWAAEGLAGINRRTARRFNRVRTGVRRWLVRDRAWLGRFLAVSGNTVRIEGCRFSFAHPDVTDELRCRALLGRYERSEREVLARHLDGTRPVIELGGGLGVIACLTNRRLRDPAAHVVVEANPSLIPLIERHRFDNGCRFALVNAAIDYAGTSHVNLRVETDFISARVDDSGGIPVQTITLGRLLDHFPFAACTLICDIEGLETALVEHESALLARRVATLIVETHPEFRTDGERAAMATRLTTAGFVEVDAVRKVRVYRNTREHRRHPSVPRYSCDRGDRRPSIEERRPSSGWS